MVFLHGQHPERYHHSVRYSAVEQYLHYCFDLKNTVALYNIIFRVSYQHGKNGIHHKVRFSLSVRSSVKNQPNMTYAWI